MSDFVFSRKPISIAGGEGVTLEATDGTTYLDAGASYACTPVGHCHPAVVDAVTTQAADLLYVQGSYPVAPRDELHERLATLAPGALENVWLCNSGTEANEAAIKFARSATDRSGIVAAKRGFHGRTAGALSATWKPKYRTPFEPLLEDVTFVPYGDGEALTEAVDENTAAVLLEPIQGEGGIHPAPAGYLETARAVTDTAGAALVFDEIQTGLGRTGDRWACEYDGVVPDVLTTAKGIASGLPLGATVCADWIAESAGPHGSTFSGNPLVCAAANATLEVIESEDLARRADRLGVRLREALADLPLEAVRGRGLLVGVDVGGGANRVLRDLALEEQVLALPAGRRVVRLLPPLVSEDEHVDAIVAALAEVLEA